MVTHDITMVTWYHPGNKRLVIISQYMVTWSITMVTHDITMVTWYHPGNYLLRR